VTRGRVQLPTLCMTGSVVMHGTICLQHELFVCHLEIRISL
jgi:hypothetical protein